MNDVLAERAQFLVDKLNEASTARLLIAIAGVPASGKTTFATRLVQHANTLLAAGASPARAILVGLDGWHLTRAQLDAMDDPRHAHDRRGSHWTFDAPAYLDFVARLRSPISLAGSEHDRAIYAPSFDHAVKDPTPDAIVVAPVHRIVVIEGLYTMLDIEPWHHAAAYMDERWWIEIDTERARSRLVKRHVETGVARDMAEAIWRAENNDEDSKWHVIKLYWLLMGQDGRFISNNMFNVTCTIQSIDDPALEIPIP